MVSKKKKISKFKKESFLRNRLPRLTWAKPLLIEETFEILNPYDTQKFPWIVKMNYYIQNLSDYDKIVLSSYTGSGYLLANNYLLNNVIDKGSYHNAFPQYLQLTGNMYLLPSFDYFKLDTFKNTQIENEMMKNFKKYAISATEMYIEDLVRIILNAPRNTGSILTYRGVPFTDSEMPNETVLNAFISTSAYAEKALQFANDDCCIYEFLVPPNTPMLYLQSISFNSNEEEILMLPNTRIKLRTKGNGFFVYDIRPPLTNK